MSRISIVVFALLQAAAAAAHADIDLIARQSVPGALSDLSGLTGALENGVPGNILGGYGSSIAYTGVGSIFIMVPVTTIFSSSSRPGSMSSQSTRKT
jgi:hypothetical protein